MITTFIISALNFINSLLELLPIFMFDNISMTKLLDAFGTMNTVLADVSFIVPVADIVYGLEIIVALSIAKMLGFGINWIIGLIRGR